MFFKKKVNDEVDSENTSIEESEEEVEYVEEEEEYVKGEPSKFSLLLNKYFHHVDRGGSLHGEIVSGILMFLLAICMLFVNMQIVAACVNNGIIVDDSVVSDANVAASINYAYIYVGSLIVSFVGTLAMGLIARLPFVQISTMALGNSLICLVSATTGLTYYNMLFLNFIASIIYVVIVAVPFIQKLVHKALPSGVRKALPVAMGLILAFTCLSMSGLLSQNSVAINPNATSQLNTLTVYGLGDFGSMGTVAMQATIGTLIGAIVIGVFKALKIKRPYLYGFLIGTLVFFLSNIAAVGINPSSDTSNPEALLNFGRVWVIAGSSKAIETPFADSYLSYASKGISEVFNNFGKVFSEGSNFSAYTGNVFSLAVTSVLTYVLMGLYNCEGTLQASEDKLNSALKEGIKPLELSRPEGTYLATITNAATNVIGPFFGVGGVTLSKSSLAGIGDDAKSGISSIIASIGFIISIFIMAFPALLATETYIVDSMNAWNYYAYGNGGFVYLTSSLVFGIADVVIACVGFNMVKGLKKIDFNDAKEYVPAIFTILVSFFFTNIVLGAAVGTLVYAMMKLCDFRKSNEVGFFVSFKEFVPNLKTFKISEVAMSVVMAIVVIFTLL